MHSVNSILYSQIDGFLLSDYPFRKLSNGIRSSTVIVGDQVVWVVPIVLATREAEFRGWLEPLISRPLWKTERTHLKRGRRKTIKYASGLESFFHVNLVKKS